MNRSYGIYPFGEQYMYDVLERKLEKRSEKGWMADYVGVFFIRYKRVEPKRRKVQIVYDPENMEYWRNDSDYTQGLEDYVGSAGWVKACDYFKQKIYYNEDPDAVPIDTDERVRLENIKESMAPLGFFTFIAIIGLLFVGLMFGDGIHWESFPFNGFFLIFGLWALPVYLLVDYIMYSLWLRKCEKNLQAGLGLVSSEPAHKVSILMTLSIFAALLFMLGYGLTSETPVYGMKQTIRIIMYFVILALARKTGVTLKDHGSKSWLTLGVMAAVIIALSFLFDTI